MMKRKLVRIWAAAGVLALISFVAAGVRAQEQPSTTQKPVMLKGGVTYEDQSSDSCEKQNENNPYEGMDPLTCYGVMAPADSRGQCSLGGMQVWKQDGNTCYYCQAINPPIQGIIIPMDDLGAADEQGFRCGVDQADACMAVCSGGESFKPPPGTEGGPGTPETPGGEPGPTQQSPTPRPSSPIPGQVSGGNPCQPFGPGGYDYCKNPAGTQPAGCECSKQTPPKQNPPTKKPQTNPIADAGQYLQGVVDGFGGCLQGLGKGIGSLMGGRGIVCAGRFCECREGVGTFAGPVHRSEGHGRRDEYSCGGAEYFALPARSDGRATALRICCDSGYGEGNQHRCEGGDCSRIDVYQSHQRRRAARRHQQRSQNDCQ
jgi:hypothetical protein